MGTAHPPAHRPLTKSTSIYHQIGLFKVKQFTVTARNQSVGLVHAIQSNICVIINQFKLYIVCHRRATTEKLRQAQREDAAAAAEMHAAELAEARRVAAGERAAAEQRWTQQMDHAQAQWRQARALLTYLSNA